MADGPKGKLNPTSMAFLAAALFYLAGAIEMMMAIHGKSVARLPGLLFLVCGVLWNAVGLKRRYNGK